MPKRKCRRIGDRIKLLKDDGYMGMSNETIAGTKVLKAALGQNFRGQILPQWPIRAAMYQSTLALFQAFWQINQKRTVLLCQLLRFPLCRDTCGRTKILQIDFANGCPIVIPRNDNVGTFT